MGTGDFHRILDIVLVVDRRSHSSNFGPWPVALGAYNAIGQFDLQPTSSLVYREHRPLSIRIERDSAGFDSPGESIFDFLSSILSFFQFFELQEVPKGATRVFPKGIAQKRSLD